MPQITPPVLWHDEATRLKLTGGTSPQAFAQQHIEQLAGILNSCLGMLDLLDQPLAAGYLCAAIESLPDQSALLPIEPDI